MVKNAITVFARLKPENNRKGIVNYKIHRRPKKHSKEDFLVLTAPQKLSEYIDNRPETWNFSFHKIFSHDVQQDDIFENVARPIIDSVFDGYNATIFAYGQTGSGKTYTITGEPGVYMERGILPRTLQYIFDVIRKNPENVYSVEVAYLEIYNENGYDLLLERKQREATTRLEDLPRVTIQEDENGTMHLKNLSFRIVDNEKEAMQFLLNGENYRSISETPMNPRSSRSHCIFTIVISVKKLGSDRYSSAKMHLVDLAGSERVYKCAIQGTTLIEAKHINLSLHFLEQVIVCLGQENMSHVPYRNSLLTSILRDSLGGNCLTTMLANLSVSNFNLEETISTCRFAQRVALVKNDVNLTFELDTRSENKLLKMENEKLRKQIEELKKRNISELPCSNSSNGSLHYYKNLVIQRDQEISRLIEILKKEKTRTERIVQEGQLIPIEISRDEKFTQIPSSRISPRKIGPCSPTRGKIRKKSTNSLQLKSQTSGKNNETISPEVKRKMKSQMQPQQTQIPSDPCLTLDSDGFENKQTKNVSELQSDRETTKFSNNVPKVVEKKIETSTKIKSPISPTERCKNFEKKAPSPNIEIKIDNNVESPDKKKTLKKNSPREKSPGFPQNVMKMIRTSRNRQSIEENENLQSSLKTETPGSGFKTPNILRSMLCIEKNSGRKLNVGVDDTLNRSKENNEKDKINKDLKKLPLTGDPEIDEEIIAFYRAKRAGGIY